MFAKHAQIAPARLTEILNAAEAAARSIPPAFPLNATVAVNPFLGQTGSDLAQTAARLERVAGIRITRKRGDYGTDILQGRITDQDLTGALDASDSALRPGSLTDLKAAVFSPPDRTAPEPFPTVADLAADATGTDWPSVIEKTLGLWAAGQFDTGQALWTPKPGLDAFAAWRAWAMQDLTPEVAGLNGFCAHVAQAPDTSSRAIMRAADALDIDAAAAETVFHRLFMDMGGWSQHARWLLWQAERSGDTDDSMADLLAIRLIWEEALLAHVPGIRAAWLETVAAHAAPAEPTRDHVVDTILQDAAERAYQRRLSEILDGSEPDSDRPFLQAAFCIDVRSEVFRRALESVDPGIQTIGFAGFFGLPLSHKEHGSDEAEAHLPVLLHPGLQTNSHAADAIEQSARISARTARAWDRFRQAAVSSFAFVESTGPVYAAKLLKDALKLKDKQPKQGPAPKFARALDTAEKADIGATVLKAMGLTRGQGNIVLLVGHGAHVKNNPHESAYHCGACGGYTGEVSARLLAGLLNDAATRAALAERGVDVAADTLFVAALHETTTDRITIFRDNLPAEREADLRRVEAWMDRAERIARTERSAKLPGATARTITSRAFDWAETRPEWGLAGCAAFIAGPRSLTRGKDLGGRAFLHSYDWKKDEDFKTLELIITAPVVVASWISLQYYGSTVAPDAFGGGNKLIHNVVGGIGVVEGNGGRLRPGLPWQAVHDGDRIVHDPLRLSVMIEAPRERIIDVLTRHPDVRALFDNRWLHLFTLKDGRIDARYRPGLDWSVGPDRLAA